MSINDTEYRRRRGWKIVLALFGAVPLVLAGVATVATQDVSAADPAVLLDQHGIQMAASYVQQHSDQFGGLYLDSKDHVVNIDVTNDASVAPALTKFRTYAPMTVNVATQMWTVRLRAVPYSLAQLNATKARITTRQPWAGLSAKYLADWYVDPSSDKVVVGVTDVTAQLVSAAAQAFGGQVTVTHGARGRAVGVRHFHVAHAVHVQSATSLSEPKSLVATDSRQTDSVPYIGGDDIVEVIRNPDKSLTVNECTAGFSWATPNSSGGFDQNVAMVTAGHCYTQGTPVQQGFVDPATSTVITTGPIGTVTTVEFGNNRPDAELLTGGFYAPSVWRTSSFSPVDQTASVQEDQPICVNGGITGENCAAVVTAVNVCDELVDSNGNPTQVCGLDNAASTNGTVLLDPTSGGDSGGPVYTPDGTTGLIANGVISGELFDNPDGTASGRVMTFTDLFLLNNVIPGAASS